MKIRIKHVENDNEVPHTRWYKLLGGLVLEVHEKQVAMFGEPCYFLSGDNERFQGYINAKHATIVAGVCSCCNQRIQ